MVAGDYKRFKRKGGSEDLRKQRMHAKKLVKWGVALTSTLVLGGVVGPVGGQLLNASSIVYAQNQESVTAVLTFYDVSDLSEIADRVYIDIKTGESIVYNYPVFDVYTLHEDYDSVLILDYDSVARRNGETIATGFRKVEKPAETPTEQPVEQPVEIPVEQPTEVPVETPTEQPTDKPTDQPISVAVIAISETEGPLSHHYITINPGETKTISAPEVEGWKLDQYTDPTYELTYDQALKTLNSAGFVWVQFWMIKDTAPTAKEPVIFTVYHRVAGGDILLLDNAVVNPGESITLTPITVDGYVARADNKYTYTYDEVATGSSSLFVAEILYDKVAVDQPTEQPAEQPTEQPVDQPVEQLAEQVVDTPTDKPVEQLTDASSLTDQTAGKVQVVAATDKKTVDKSAPSTPAVKPEEVSQPVAKTLPKTGDSGSILLVLGGVLSGLSGLGLAATSRKRD